MHLLPSIIHTSASTKEVVLRSIFVDLLTKFSLALVDRYRIQKKPQLKCSAKSGSPTTKTHSRRRSSKEVSKQKARANNGSMTGSVVFKAVDDAVISFLDNVMTPSSAASNNNNNEASKKKEKEDPPEVIGVPVLDSTLVTEDKKEAEAADSTTTTTRTTMQYSKKRLAMVQHQKQNQKQAQGQQEEQENPPPPDAQRDDDNNDDLAGMFRDEDVGLVAMAREIGGGLASARDGIGEGLAAAGAAASETARRGQEYASRVSQRAAAGVTDVARTVEESEPSKVLRDEEYGMAAMFREIGDGMRLPDAGAYLVYALKHVKALSCTAIEGAKEKAGEAVKESRVSEMLALDDKPVVLEPDVDLTPIGMVREASNRFYFM